VKAGDGDQTICLLAEDSNILVVDVRDMVAKFLLDTQVHGVLAPPLPATHLETSVVEHNHSTHAQPCHKQHTFQKGNMFTVTHVSRREVSLL